MSGVAWRWSKLPTPHLFGEGETPGVCDQCPLPERHQVHDPAKVAELEAQEQAKREARLAEDRRRTGEG